jgi:hypothetical protein
MGVSNGANGLYHLINLTPDDVVDGFRGVFNERQDKLNMDFPTVDADVNNIACQVVGGTSCDSKSAAVASCFQSTWGHAGLVVVLCCDGDTRLDAKKASCDRRAKRACEYIGSYKTLTKACRLKNELESGTISEDKIVICRKAIKELKVKASRKLARSEARWPPDFANALNAKLEACSANIPNDNGGYIGSVIKADWEADYVIMGRFASGKIIGAIVNDSDLNARLGDEFIAVKKFTMGGQQIKGSKMMIAVSTSLQTLQKFKSHMSPGLKAKIVDAKCPIWENIQSPQLRCLVVVACGCDVYPPDTHNFGPTTMKKMLDKLKETMI